MWMVFALLSAVFAALTSILAKVGIDGVNSNLATAIRTMVVVVMAWGMVFLTHAQGEITAISRRSWLFLILSGLATGASWLCYFKALQIGDVNKVVPVDKSSSVLTILLALLLLHEEISVCKGIGIIGIGFGTWLMIQPRDGEPLERKSGKGWFVYAALSALFASLTAILGKIGIEAVESNLGTAIRTGVVLVMAWVVVFVTRKPDQPLTVPRGELGLICLSGLATGASWLCYYRALQLGPASLVAPVDKLSILVTILFSRIVLHERLTRRAFLGLVLLTVGTLLLLF